MPDVLFGYRLDGTAPDFTPIYLAGKVMPDGSVTPAAGTSVTNPDSGGGGGGGGTRTAFLHPFAVDAPFNLGVATTATFEATTDTRTSFWIGKANAAPNGGIAQVNDQSTGYSVSIAQASPTDPIVTVTHANTGAVLIPASQGFRVPANFTPPIPPGGETGDRNSVVIQPDGRNGYDLYRFIRQSSTSFTSTSAEAIDLHSSGIIRGIRAANISLANGLIRRHEIQAVQAGTKDDYGHALAVSIPETALGPPSPGYVWPANARDSTLITYSGPIPMGSFAAIPTNLNAASTVSGLEAKALANTLTRYGMYIIDRSSTYALYVEQMPDGTAAPSWLLNAASAMKAAWRDDLMGLVRFVTNNTSTTPGGGVIGATRLAPNAAPLA
jgi:hypothetical protein